MQHDTIADLLLDRLGDNRPGLRTRERTWTWDDVVKESAARAALATELRTEGPFHIGILLANVPEFLFWLGGAALSGATVVGINSTRRGPDLEQEVRHTDCQLLITDRAGQELLDGLDTGVPPDRFLLVDDASYTARTLTPAAPRKAPDIAPDTRMLLLFTSGTTGASKAASCSQGRLAALGHSNSAKYDIGRDDISYCCMPLFHGNALMALWAPSLAAGACVALVPKFSASGFLPDVRFHGATYFTYVGKAIGYLLGTPESPDDHDNPLTHGFGTEASPEDQAAFRRRFGARLFEGYGSSEGSGMIRLDPDAPPGALGRPAHDGVAVVNPETFEVRPPALLDAYGRVTNAEEAIGEIVDRHGAAKFEGYYKNDAANAERVRNGWYWTGDLGYLDPDGCLYFAGRSGDWIRADGENTSALLVERILRRHPQVLAAAVFGVPDPRSGDQVMAALEVAEGTAFEDLRLPEFLDRQDDLGTKSAPRFVRLSTELPTTGSNKLRKKEMQLVGWHTDDPVHRWAGRDRPAYALMTGEDKQRLREEFLLYGRRRFLP
ncbi:AMP-binding protein [Streptomyces sp. NBC_01387]|uniref:AMP-binding protein n=1 Tax=unclassified Streptomyces TaxID=2593676 RepID=UPI002254C5B6|nr:MULTISPECIES: AMP-binding protein [unclassified Streptomyces]MCX4552841.1 AMP-binding protein [Streptomyces sp. NBC_01500]WSC24172.1 AMP-binding protein [Streptomyces sp. NBC_01766]WSV58059.1 AMP-binding protein [Streptomyces sp. NBC_01014]